jgi:lipopolysaccharide transport system permease protein
VSDGAPRPAGPFAPGSSPPVTVVRPTRGWASLDPAELWRYRELLFFLAWRDVKVRYKQTALGAAWAVVQPLATMAVFSLFFGRLARMPSDGVPYPLFALAALVPWTLFSNGLSQAANSMVASQTLVTKVYFPRLAIPVAAVLSGAVDAAFSVPALLGLMLYYDVALTARALWLPVPLLLALATALGAGLWLAALNVRYRDVRYVVPFLLQLWLFANPIAYPSSLLSEPWRTVYGLNPMAGVIEGCRWALLGTGPSPWPMLATSAVAALVLLAGGILTFRRLERTFADVI